MNVRCFLRPIFLLVLSVSFLGVSVFAVPPSLFNFQYGLSNICFFNSLLQNLYNMQSLTVALFSENVGGDAVMKAYKDVVQSFYKGEKEDNKIVSLYNEMIAEGASCGMVAGNQEDLVIPLGQIFGLRTVVASKVNSTECRVVYGLNNAKNAFVKRNTVVKLFTPEVFLLLSPESDTLKGCLEKYFSGVIDPDLEYEEIGDISKKREVAVVMRQLAGNLPEFLIINLKRYLTPPEVALPTRVARAVAPAFEIDLRSFVHDAPLKSVAQYNLIGVSLHLGPLTSSGHYTAYIKDQYDSNRSWYYCNDSSITLVSDLAGMENAIAKNGYLFFYRRKDKEEASIAAQVLEPLARSLKNIATT
ncbi:TPA: hypothetical protein DDZ86_03815 [Candidatus Dependentiae bacterium]|nr:MAG: hypothetical protein UW09_C0003G0117 [candidate division TM6 bacterium GW2011_GWF2_43_87]HBL98743.1 hypothetical protein [Candidatus Dependentiae bacterium]